MATKQRIVEVWADWNTLREPARLGVLHAVPGRGKQILAFEYDERWLRSNAPVHLDPGVQWTPGVQYPSAGHESFGMFADASPDRWGRVLMQRREAQLAREQKRKERTLVELDYLLGVFDGHRMGGLRFRIEGGPFLDDNADLASPPWTSLRELEQISLRLEQDGAERDPKFSAWLRMMVAPGRSLGGARPKASVLAPDKSLWLAKFPSRDDDRDVGGWELVAHTLARRAGVTTADARAERFSKRHHTFLARRFDRGAGARRIHFASAMTMLDRRDGDEPVSYLDLANVLVQHGSRTASDLEQLWRRIVFYVCISNLDDHLRNHGLLLTRQGWTLAPAYDINPSIDGEGLALNISETDNAQDLELVRDVAKHFRVRTPQRADVIIGEVCEAVRSWRRVAAAVKIPKGEQDRMAPAFRLAESRG